MDFLTTDMKIDTAQHERGSALLEALLGVALLGMFLVILAGSITYLEQSTLRANQHADALSLASEGLEAVRSMRDADFALLTNGAHGLTHANGVWEFSGSSDLSTSSTRIITISHEGASTTRIISIVRWGQAGHTTDTSLETYLTDWRREN